MKEKAIRYNPFDTFKDGLTKFVFDIRTLMIIKEMDKYNRVIIDNKLIQEISKKTKKEYRTVQNYIYKLVKNNIITKIDTNLYKVNEKYFLYYN